MGFSALKVSPYPQGYLQQYGHIKVNGVMPSFNATLQQINNDLQQRQDDGDSDDNDDGSEIDSTFAMRRGVSEPTIFPVSSQAYNELSHRLSSRSGSHDVQQGSITGALAGAYATNSKSKQTAQSKLAFCQVKLPIDRVKQKLAVEQCPRALRMEHVFGINVTAIKKSKQNGL